MRMRVSELLIELELFLARHGDMDVETLRIDGHRAPHIGPRLDHKKVLSGRESRPGFATSQENQGEPVCRM